MSWLTVDDYRAEEWRGGVNAAAREQEYCAQLEAGSISYFSVSPFDLIQRDVEFLLALKPPIGKERIAFPPAATWLVYTDGVPQAALSGQFAMEQTFIVPVEALAAPGVAPIRVLEKLAGRATS